LLDIEVGNIVRMKPKFYGPDTPDQWADITGIVLEVIEASGSSPGLTLLVQHPEDTHPIPIFAFLDDVEKLEDKKI
tara:strand:- start:1114 stop:1341 length:228 start_codon:yes stop_codon:yes gene_type:complete